MDMPSLQYDPSETGELPSVLKIDMSTDQSGLPPMDRMLAGDDTINANLSGLYGVTHDYYYDYFYNYTYDHYETSDYLPLDEVLPTVTIYSIIGLFGIIGNLLVIFSIARVKRMRSITNLFLLSLATADLLLVCFCVPVKVSVHLSIMEIFVKHVAIPLYIEWRMHEHHV